MEGDSKVRCWKTTDPLYIEYHDKEWGVPVHDDRTLFEFLLLEGFQAGVSWALILRKRENFRRAFDNFDPVKVSKYTEEEVERLLNDPGILRNKLKVRSAISNAQVFMKVQEEYGSFDRYVWGLVGGEPINNGFESFSEMPSKTETSEAMNKDMKKRGFKFVGPVICYSFMQAVGMVNDHLTHCFRYDEISKQSQ
ncbi:DNA-3-methyladenine glycosylase I [Candidatus Bathyarchaeota archaeon]|nr:MAG: DNA-3-methyladenine glycosylase I [Candidatus Bathyarchaeota archaeon]